MSPLLLARAQYLCTLTVKLAGEFKKNLEDLIWNLSILSDHHGTTTCYYNSPYWDFSEAQQTIWLIMLLRGQRLIKLPLEQTVSKSRDSGCPICGWEQRQRRKRRKALLWGHWEGRSLGFKDKRHFLTRFSVPAMLSAPEHWDINSWPVNSHLHHLPFTNERKEQGLWPRTRWATRLPRRCQGHSLNIPHSFIPSSRQYWWSHLFVYFFQSFCELIEKFA